MRASSRLLLGLVVAVFFAGCHTTDRPETVTNPSEADQAAIDRLRQTWLNTATQADISKAVELFADQGALLPSDAGLVRGQDSLRQFVEASNRESRVTNLQVKPEQTIIRGDMAIEFGSCSGTLTSLDPAGSSIEASNNYVLVMQKSRAGDWQIVRSASVNAGKPR